MIRKQRGNKHVKNKTSDGWMLQTIIFSMAEIYKLFTKKSCYQ